MGGTGDFAAWLEAKRRTHRLSRKQLAQLAGCMPVLIARLESGASLPTPALAKRLVELLDAPERVVARAVAAAERPAPIVPAAAPAPLALTPFIGRAVELTQALALLRRPEVRVLTLTGPGGAGKTRLALALAAALAADFADGVAIVELAAVREPELVPVAIAVAAGVGDSAGALPERLHAALAGQERLLLLDNFEQVLSAARSVAALVAACPRVKVLVTSRAALRIAGEYEYPVPPLSLPAPSTTYNPDELAHYDAVQLFVARATASAPGFALSAANAADVATICARLEGLPLALELAAARIRFLPPAQLSARLDRRLPLLTGGGADHPARHRTLRAAIAWSYDLLDVSEQRLFRWLAVFSGGATLDAVEVVCAAPPGAGELGALLDRLAALVDNSLVRQEDGGPDQPTPRFTMLETLREYGLEQLAAAEEEEAARQAHARFFLDLGEQVGKAMETSAQADWATRLSRELDNLYAALEYCSRPGGDVELGLQIAAAPGRFWDRAGRWTETRQRLARLLAMPGGSAELRLAVLESMMILAQLQRDSSEARQVFEMILTTARAAGDLRGIMKANMNLGVTLYHQADAAGSVLYLELALVAGRELAQPLELAMCLSNLGVSLMALAEFSHAQSCYEEALLLSRASGSAPSLALALVNLAEVLWLQDDMARVGQIYEETLLLMHNLGWKEGVATTVLHLGYFALTQGNSAAATARFREALAIYRELDQRSGMLSGLAGLAEVAAAAGNWPHAATLLVAIDNLLAAWNVFLDQIPRRAFEQTKAAAATRLPAAAFSAASTTGKLLSYEEALALALADQPAHPITPAAAPPANSAALLAHITEREAAVLRLVAAGLSNSQVAADLTISITTVNTHLRSLYSKLDLPSRGALIRYAMDHGLA